MSTKPPVRFVNLVVVTPFGAPGDCRADADRCFNALMKEFPQESFEVVPGNPGFCVRVVVGPNSLPSVLSAFARGFMASAHLWER